MAKKGLGTPGTFWYFSKKVPDGSSKNNDLGSTGTFIGTLTGARRAAVRYGTLSL